MILKRRFPIFARVVTLGENALWAINGAVFGIFFLCSGQITAAEQVVASAEHNFRGEYEVFSYRAVPKENLDQAEKLAKYTYGSLVKGKKSSSYMFMCLWRNTDMTQLNRVRSRPNKIFLSCHFGLEALKKPDSLLETSELYNKSDRASLWAIWELAEGTYELTRFEVEIKADRKTFRSINFKDELSEIIVEQVNVKFPEDETQPLKFNIKTTLDHRQNTGDEQRSPSVSASFSGVAEPTPDWMNY